MEVRAIPRVPRPVFTQGRSAEPPGPQHPPRACSQAQVRRSRADVAPLTNRHDGQACRRDEIPTQQPAERGYAAGNSPSSSTWPTAARCSVRTFLPPSRGACGRSLRSRPRRPALPDLSSRMPGTSRASCGRRTHRLRRRSGSWRSGTTISETCVGSTSRCSLSGQAGMHTTLGPTLMISSARRRGIQAVGLLCRSYSYRESGLSSGASPQSGSAPAVSPKIISVRSLFAPA